MHRSRTLLRVLAGAAGAVLLTVTTTPVRAVEGEPHPRRPNVVLILLDDLDTTTTPLWSVMPRTRTLLADRGLTFANAFDPTPICCPARATILTGRYGHNTGVLTNGGPQGGWHVFHANGEEDDTFPVALEAAGYRTMLVGKYMNGYEERPGFVPPGWSEWYGAVDNMFYAGYGYALNENGTRRQYGWSARDYATDVVAAKTVDFVDRAEADDTTPFFAYVAPTAPHLPLSAPPRYLHDPRLNTPVPRHDNFYEADLSDKPTWLRLSGRVRSASWSWNNADHRNRLGALLAADDMVASIVDALDRNSELEDTYLMFTSDNGYNLGAHRLIHKMAPYEESLRVPLLVVGPGITPGTDAHMIVHPDLAPTVLDLAGLEVPAGVDGRSLVPLLHGEDPGPWRVDFPARYAGGGGGNGIGSELPPPLYAWLFVVLLGQDLPAYRALRSESHLYVQWYDGEMGPGRHEYELYDLTADPWQLSNLLATPEGRAANAGLTASMQARLDVLGACAGETCRS